MARSPICGETPYGDPRPVSGELFPVGVRTPTGNSSGPGPPRILRPFFHMYLASPAIQVSTNPKKAKIRQVTNGKSTLVSTNSRFCQKKIPKPNFPDRRIEKPTTLVSTNRFFRKICPFWTFLYTSVHDGFENPKKASKLLKALLLCPGLFCDLIEDFGRTGKSVHFLAIFLIFGHFWRFPAISGCFRRFFGKKVDFSG